MESWFKEIDLEFCEFYFKAIRKLAGNGDHKNDGFKPLRKFIQRLSANNKLSQSQLGKSSKIVDSLEETLYNRIAWIYQNGTCLSSAVAYHFRKATIECSKVTSELFKIKKLRICSVNSGSPSDLVALVKVVESVVGKDEGIDIHVSIIHSDKKWKTTCLVVLRCLERFQNALWKIDFIECDFRFSCSDEANRAIKDANIVSVVNFFCDLEDVEKKTQKNIFERIHENLEPGSLLFLVDDYRISTRGVAGDGRGEIPGFDLFYDGACDLHMLSVAAVSKHFYLYHNYFGRRLCNTALKQFCRIWLKLPRDHPSGPDLKSAVAEKLLDGQIARCAKLTRECSLRELCFTWEVENYFGPTMEEIKSGRKNSGEKKREFLKAKRVIELELKEKTRQLAEKKAEEMREILIVVKLERELKKVRREYGDLREKRRMVNFQNKETMNGRHEIYLLSIEMLLERLEQKYSRCCCLYFKF